MIGNTSTLLAPRASITQLIAIKLSLKVTVPTLTTSLLALIILAATHTTTYDVTLIYTPAQQDVQQSVTTSQQSARQHQPTNSAINASQALIRINQDDVSQYASQAEHDQWWASTCSTASMTEVFDSYGYHYHITDVLQVESNIGTITADNGLLFPEGIDQTALRFGFLTTTLNNPTLDQIVDIANKGQPVIVNFPPQTWSGGHFLVVRGGDSTTVKLADSSILNHGNGLQSVTRAYFLTYWRGFAKVLTPSPYIIISKPTVSTAAINNMLAAYHSPVSGQGQMIYDTAVHYDLDPAYIVATFGNESTFGTKGEATRSLSPGNLRCIKNARCEDGYAQFDTWQQGFDVLCKLLVSDLYAGDHRIIPETIIPRFAPNGDSSNNEARYISVVEHIINILRVGGS